MKTSHLNVNNEVFFEFGWNFSGNFSGLITSHHPTYLHYPNLQWSAWCQGWGSTSMRTVLVRSLHYDCWVSWSPEVTWGDHGVTHGVIMAPYFWLLKDTWSYLHLSTSWIAVNMSNSSSVDSWKTLRVQSIRFSFFWVCSPEKASTTWPGTFSFGTSLSSWTGHIHVSLLLIFQPLRICKLQDIAFETIPNAPRSECQEKLMANSLQHRC